MLSLKIEVAVTQVLADQIAVAIENTRAFELSQKAVEELHEIDRIKNQFMANMSHELSNTFEFNYWFLPRDPQRY